MISPRTGEKIVDAGGKIIVEQVDGAGSWIVFSCSRIRMAG